MSIYDYLGHGKENAITKKRLAEKMNVPESKIRSMIEAARIGGGAQILMSCRNRPYGYYLASDDADQAKAEYIENLQSFGSRRKKIKRTFDGIRNEMRERFPNEQKERDL